MVVNYMPVDYLQQKSYQGTSLIKPLVLMYGAFTSSQKGRL